MLCGPVVDVMPPEVPTSPIPSAEVKQEEGGVVEENVNTVEVITSASSTTIPCLPPKPGKLYVDVGVAGSTEDSIELKLLFA